MSINNEVVNNGLKDGTKVIPKCIGGTRKLRCLHKIPKINCKCENPNCAANKTRSSIEQTGSAEPFFEKAAPPRVSNNDQTILNDPNNVLWDTKNPDEYWCRSSLRMYPLVANASGILNNEVRMVSKRETLSDGPKKYYERRHFGVFVMFTTLNT
ncbi:uncharacterized protein LOC123300548 [Chrysoperla carnea]|uniref:uncharacterized protein LOC123300548 n=1 Tax=Chrysoperla carnea TaxID=189513 RepID=UPI001D076E11|nr:uncharacterized protein LOC123300548 [Chrysoperla carnea]